ncbi:MAG: 16S rRNA processing protein RimM [Flavobacteriales bacterium]|nr:MAG: 16S rRNA processing protein RimM [Flavobacteriales bacterium]
MRKEDTYFLGKITRKHGLSGQVVIKLDTDQPEFYNKMESILVEINGLLVPFFVEKQKWQKNDTKIISFKNATEKLVEQVIGKNVFMPLATLPKLTGNQFYYHEIIGFELLDENDISFGEIQSVNDQTPQHYFVTDLNQKEIVVPIIKDWILTVDRENKKIKMQLPEGLLEVFE